MTIFTQFSSALFVSVVLFFLVTIVSLLVIVPRYSKLHKRHELLKRAVNNYTFAEMKLLKLVNEGHEMLSTEVQLALGEMIFGLIEILLSQPLKVRDFRLLEFLMSLLIENEHFLYAHREKFHYVYRVDDLSPLKNS